jgi:hypothetical protein
MIDHIAGLRPSTSVDESGALIPGAPRTYREHYARTFEEQTAHGARDSARPIAPAPGADRDPMMIMGGTHRFAALMHIMQSGDLGNIDPAAVVGRNGETIQELFELYQAGHVGAHNAEDCFTPGKARELVESLRQHGYVTDVETAQRTGAQDSMTAERIDSFSPVNLVPYQEGMEHEPIQDKLERFLFFVEHGRRPTGAEWREDNARREERRRNRR